MDRTIRLGVILSRCRRPIPVADIAGVGREAFPVDVIDGHSTPKWKSLMISSVEFLTQNG